ncbi:MAG: LytTR family transcriptional regulator DNA-binding domain-containing protein [Clostridiales bacterium]|nr:LytTR family transcriptional regulator DNA-binding domain-containing protein [Clostridiales bacterium]
MRILLFSESDEWTHVLKGICNSNETCADFIQVRFDRIKTLGLTSKEDVYIIDDAYYETIDGHYLEILKTLKVDLIVLVSELKSMERYIGFNIVEYMCRPFDATRIRLCLQRIYKRNSTMNKMRLKEISKKILVRNKNEVNIVLIGDIYFVRAFSDYVQVYTKEGIYVSIDTIDHYENMVSDSFFRVAEDVLVNFDKIDDIQKLTEEYYKLSFIDFEPCTYMRDFLFESNAVSKGQKNRQAYIVETIKKIVI